MTVDSGEVRAGGVAGPGADAGAELRREFDRRLEELARVTAEAVRPPTGSGAADPRDEESEVASRPGGFRRAGRSRARGVPAAGAPGGGPASPPRGGIVARVLRAIGRLLGVRRR